MKNPATEFGTLMLCLNGQDLKNDTWKSKLISVLHLILVGGMFVLGILQPIFNYQGVEALAESFDIISNYFEYMSRLIIYRYYLKPLKQLIRFDDFWPVDYCGLKMEQKQLEIYNQVLKAFKILCNLGMILLVASFIKPLFIKDRVLPYAICFSTEQFLQTPYYEMIFLWQFLNAYIIITLVFGFDSLFISILAFGYCQMLMLKHELINLKIQFTEHTLDEENYFTKMKECICLHNRILKFYNMINQIFSLSVLAEFVGSFLNICMSLYLMANRGFAGLDVITVRCLMTIMANAWLLLMFCFAGSMVTSQYDSIYNAIYDSEWYMGASKSRRIGKGIILIMQMSQRQLEIRAGRVFSLNMETYATILRLSFSFYTLLKSVS